MLSFYKLIPEYGNQIIIKLSCVRPLAIGDCDEAHNVTMEKTPLIRCFRGFLIALLCP